MSQIRQKQLAIFISNLTNPVLLVILSMTYLISRYTDNLEQAFVWLAVGLVLIVIGPGLIYIVTNRRNEKEIDIDISDRSDRPLPLMLASLGALFGGYLISDRLESNNLLLISNVLVAMLLLLTVTTLVWKISIHASTLTALTTLLVLFRGEAFLWLFFLIIPVAWARYFLRQHTPAQLVAGSVLGIAVTYFAWVVFRP